MVRTFRLVDDVAVQTRLSKHWAGVGAGMCFPCLVIRFVDFGRKSGASFQDASEGKRVVETENALRAITADWPVMFSTFC